MAKFSGASTSCLFGQDAMICVLALGSDYSGSVGSSVVDGPSA